MLKNIKYNNIYQKFHRGVNRVNNDQIVDIAITSFGGFTDAFTSGVGRRVEISNDIVELSVNTVAEINNKTFRFTRCYTKYQLDTKELDKRQDIVKYAKNLAKNLNKVRKENQKIVDYVEDILKKILKKILAKTSSYKKVLVVGLGNREVVCDSFGVNVTSKILTTGHIDANLGAKVFCLCPMVECQSGISTSQIVCAIAKNIGADLVILVDSFMTSSIKRLAHSFQFSSNGLTPGGAVGKTNSIDKSSLGIETISIGIPFMLNLKDICSNIKKDIIVSQKDIMQNIKKTSDIVANVINCVLFPSLNKQEICELICT